MRRFNYHQTSDFPVWVLASALLFFRCGIHTSNLHPASLLRLCFTPSFSLTPLANLQHVLICVVLFSV